MAPDFHEDVKAISKQAEAGTEANADYGSGPGHAIVPLPQLPDLTVLADQRSVQQGGNRPLPDEAYDGVEISDDESRVGTGSTPAVDRAQKAAKAAAKADAPSS